MSADEWDADDFEPVAPSVAVTDKWEGEDDEDVKDSWDAEDDEEKKEEGAPKAVQRKKKKPLADRIAEKEAARLAQEQQEIFNKNYYEDVLVSEKRSMQEQKEENRVLTKEEKQAEAERLKKIQEESDLRLAKEAFGVEATGIDAMFPVTEEEFTKFKDALKLKISSFNSSKHYGTFIHELMQDLIMDLSVEDLKKISTNASSLFHEKQRLQKEQEKKKKKKNKGIVTLERDTDFNDIAAAGRGDYDDSYYDEDFI